MGLSAGSGDTARAGNDVAPPARFGRRINDFLVRALLLERRLDPAFRDGFDQRFQRPLTDLVQALIVRRRPDDHLGLAEERELPGEQAAGEAVAADLATFLRRQHYPPGQVLRAGNTKTYGVLRGEFTVLPGLAEPLRRGVFAEPRSYRAWVRFAGPGPQAPPDIEDNGILSVGIKLMGLPGPKLLDDERYTQDFTALSAPTFTTPTILENRKLQQHLLAGTPVLYFLDPRDPHLLDAVMQALYSRPQHSPLETRYWSDVAYLLGAGQAMHYALRPCSNSRTPIPRPPPADYLRQAMAETLSRRDVEFDFLVQLQTDPRRMPIEDASVAWPEALSPLRRVATLRLPAQRFDSPAQLAFAGNLAYNPWHCLAEHRPLGNQNRARRAMYLTLSRLRQQMNGRPHLEPTGDEVFA